MAVSGGLYRNEGGHFWLYHFKFRGKPEKGSTGCESLSAARVWLRAYRQQLALGEVGAASKAAPTLAEALRDYTTAQTGVVTQKYLDQKKNRINEHFSKDLKRPLTDFTTALLEEARQRYLQGEWAGNCYAEKKTGRSVGGWNSLLRDLRAVLGWALNRELIREIPFRLAQTKTQEAVRPVLWPEQVRAFLRHVDRLGSQDVRTAVRLMLYLGLREDEALGARWEWLRERTCSYLTGDSKNRKVRQIAVPGSLFAYVKKHHKRVEEGYLLPAADGQPHREGFTSQVVGAAGRACGVLGLAPHRLRATFASAHYEMGTPPARIQEMLGHESLSTTMGYVVTRPKNLEEAQEAYAALIEGRVPTGLPPKKQKPAKKPAKPGKVA